ncbi:MAG TPA: S26 family signal peptidase, partial [Reyranella sp.]|nr:S26 family signal peptidase [Reyranella sp.]
MTRFGYVMTTSLTVLAVGGLSCLPVAPKLIWNASASVPLGLYSIAPARHVEVTDLVAVETPEPLASFMAERRYLPRGVPLMKRVAAIAGQQVCRDGAHITIDGIDMGEALARDRAGRALPSWQGCRRI